MKNLFVFIFLILASCNSNIEKEINKQHSYEVDYLRSSAVALSTIAIPNKDLVIPEDMIVYIDKSIDLGELKIMGQLHCDSLQADDDIKVSARGIMIKGTLQCGTSKDPYNNSIEFALKGGGVNPKLDPMYKGMMVMHGGKLILTGNSQKSGWLKLGKTAEPGDDFIVLENQSISVAQEPEHEPIRNKGLRRKADDFRVQKKIRPGDTIVIGPTGYNYEEAESFKVTKVEGKYNEKIYLDNKLQYRHWGERQRLQTVKFGNVYLDERAEVANLSRNIVITSLSRGLAEFDNKVIKDDQYGGHVMVHHMGSAYINSVEFYKVGQAGIKGRYPFHWHFVGNADGQFVKNSSIHNSFQRCITIHQTNNALLYNNVCYDFKGHGYFLEDGVEVGNKIIKNLAVKASAPSLSNLLLRSDDTSKSESAGRFPSVSGFWISNPDNIVTHNIVSGSVGSGFWMAFEDEIKDADGNVIANPINTDTKKFDYNSAHSTQVGMTWDGAPTGDLVDNPNNESDRALSSAHYSPQVTPVFKGLKAYKNLLTGMYFRGNTAVFENTLLADNGWSVWFSSNQIIKSSVIVGRTENNDDLMDHYFFNHPKMRAGRYRRSGAVLYDGPLEIRDTDFVDFSVEKENYALGTRTINSTYVPITSVNATKKYMNITKNIGFMPDPKYRIHLESIEENQKTGTFLQHGGSIRDLDGSFSGAGVEAVIVPNSSLGITEESNCYAAESFLRNYDICPSEYEEAGFYFRQGIYWWSTPFAVFREDGRLNFPIEEWSGLSFSKNNNGITFANDSGLTYELIPRYTYYQSQNLSSRGWFKVDTSSESKDFKMPVVKIKSFGQNCRLERSDSTISESFSLNDLKSRKMTSYFSQGDDIYLKVVPDQKFDDVKNDSEALASAYRSLLYNLVCDNKEVSKSVIGEIDSVIQGKEVTTVEGWACNLRVNTSIDVRLLAVTKTSVSIVSQQTSESDLDSESLAKCAIFSNTGKRFKFVLNNSFLENFRGQSIVVEGISESDEPNANLKNSFEYQFLSE